MSKRQNKIHLGVQQGLLYRLLRNASHVQVVKLAAENGEGEDDPCHHLMGVHPFVQKYRLLKQKSELSRLVLLRLLNEI